MDRDMDEVVAALVMKKLPMVEPVGDRKTNAINSQRASWNAAIDFALDALDAPVLDWRQTSALIAAAPAPLDGQEAQVLMMAEGVMSRDREIATLRAALDGLVRACRAPHGTCRFCGVPLSAMHDDECPVEQAIRAVEPGYAAALATVKETR